MSVPSTAKVHEGCVCWRFPSSPQGPPGPTGPQGPVGAPGPAVSVTGFIQYLTCRSCEPISRTNICLSWLWSLFRAQMVSLVPEVSRVCSARREMKDPEDSPDLQAQLVCRCVLTRNLTTNLHLSWPNRMFNFSCFPSRACLDLLVRKVKLETLVKWWALLYKFIEEIMVMTVLLHVISQRLSVYDLTAYNDVNVDSNNSKQSLAPLTYERRL